MFHNGWNAMVFKQPLGWGGGGREGGYSAGGQSPQKLIYQYSSLLYNSEIGWSTSTSVLHEAAKCAA